MMKNLFFILIFLLLGLAELFSQSALRLDYTFRADTAVTANFGNGVGRIVLCGIPLDRSDYRRCDHSGGHVWRQREAEKHLK